MWARAPFVDSFNACTGPWQYLQRINSPRSVSASYRVHGSQRPRTLTSHSVITGGFFLLGMMGEMLQRASESPVRMFAGEVKRRYVRDAGHYSWSSGQLVGDNTQFGCKNGGVYFFFQGLEIALD